jgi:hypothetical protein
VKINLIKLFILPLCLLAVFLSSCLGVSADITIKADGSGKIALEYRVSQALESIGRLDGNEKMPVVPASRLDFERTVSRIPGLNLSKYGSKNTRNDSGGSDLVTNVTLDFKDTAALLAFLDSTGTHAAIVQEGQGALLRLTLLDPSDGISNSDLLTLLREISGNYGLGLSLNLPRNATLTTVPASIPAARVVSSGKRVSFHIGIWELLTLKDGVALEIRW